MVVVETPPCATQINLARGAAEARLHGAPLRRPYLGLCTPAAPSLPASELGERVAIDNVVGDNSLDNQVVDSRGHAVHPRGVPIAQVVHEGNLKSFEGKQARVRWQGAVGRHPHDVGVDEADVEDTPEEVFPPTPACTPHSVIGAQLIEAVHAPHVAVIVPDAHRHRHVLDLPVASGRPHEVLAGVVGGHHEDVALVVPLGHHDAVIAQPLD